jgi:hypothetical protein
VVPLRISLTGADARLKYMFGAIAQRRVSDLKL